MVLQLDGDKLSLAAFEALLLHVQASDTEYPDGFCNEIRLGLSLPKRQAAIVIKNIDVQSAALPKHEDPRFSMQVTVFHCLSPSFHCLSMPFIAFHCGSAAVPYPPRRKTTRICRTCSPPGRVAHVDGVRDAEVLIEPVS